jgi:transposase-like protein
MARPLPWSTLMAVMPPVPSPPPKPNGFHGAVSEFKRRLIEATLTQAGGNRTRAARALGLQRTYLLRLMREFEVRIPPPPGPWRRETGENGHAPRPEADMPRAALTPKEKGP